MKGNNGARGLDMKKMFLMMALIPMTVASLIMLAMAYVKLGEALEEQTQHSLVIAANGLKEYYEWDIVNKGGIEYEVDYIDTMSGACGIDLTLFKDNVRFVTSIRDSSGERIEGTQCNAAVWEQ